MGSTEFIRVPTWAWTVVLSSLSDFCIDGVMFNEVLLELFESASWKFSVAVAELEVPVWEPEYLYGFRATRVQFNPRRCMKAEKAFDSNKQVVAPSE